MLCLIRLGGKTLEGRFNIQLHLEMISVNHVTCAGQCRRYNGFPNPFLRPFGPPAWGLGGGLTTLPRKTHYLLRITTHSLGTGRIS
jgi:hypothetical protein